MGADSTRKATKKLLGLIEEGLDKDTVITACMSYMSEADVADMCHANGFFDDEEEPDESDEDGDEDEDEPEEDDED